jgi:pyridoxal phosphate enzyme (YggS family)
MTIQEHDVNTIGERLAAVQERIAAAARQAGRDPGDVQLIAVTKTHPADVVRSAFAGGCRVFGENRVQEAEGKIDALADVRASVQWHLIGHLQRNKAKKAAALFDLVHSLDSLSLAQTLDRHAAAAGRRLPVLLQVNMSGEANKEGFALAGWQDDHAVLDRFVADVEQIVALPHLDVQGLMTVAPWSDDPGVVQPVFRATRLLRDELARRFSSTDWRHLSMGMTGDFELAIVEGATLVRIGRAIFGERDKRDKMTR